jgi:demethylmenaquinone methyltransferase/2-methoxy-6-polyprenyl-1,4-benzoquinol methylase
VTDPAEALRTYYAARAPEYEAIYAKPERPADLATLRDLVAGFARGRRMLEVACGTGYWTAVLAATARSVLATDVTDEMLALARAKALATDIVTFARADAYRREAVDGAFDGAFAGFWWTHVLRSDRSRFLGGLHRRLEPGARVMLIDNRYVEGSSTPVSRTDAAGNLYQQRRLADGSTHEVLKNFPSPEELRRDLAAAGVLAPEIVETTYFWVATYDRPQVHG